MADEFFLDLNATQPLLVQTRDVVHTEVMGALKVKANFRKKYPMGVVDRRITMSGSVPVLQGESSIGSDCVSSPQLL